METPLSVLIADDEPLARAHLRRLLEAQGVHICGEAANASHAIQQCRELRPDALFLDIQMPGPDGIATAGALRQLTHPVLLVYVTGYSEYATAAFEQDAVDYLLKPVSEERLLSTLTRLQGRRHFSNTPDSLPPRYLAVRGEYAMTIINTEDIVFAEARDKNVFLYTQSGTEHRSYQTLTQLDLLLPSDRFCRIHDSYLVNLDFISELNFLGNHSYSVLLRDRRTLPVGRTRYTELRHRLGLP